MNRENAGLLSIAIREQPKMWLGRLTHALRALPDGIRTVCCMFRQRDAAASVVAFTPCTAVEPWHLRPVDAHMPRRGGGRKYKGRNGLMAAMRFAQVAVHTVNDILYILDGGEPPARFVIG